MQMQHGASMDGESPPEFFAATLQYELELHDTVLREVRRRLAALEADSETDELTLAIARNEVFMRKRYIAQKLMS